MSKIKEKLPEGYSVLDKEGINQIPIWQPRWHDRRVLVADSRLFDRNEIIILHKDFRRSYFITGDQARQYPIKQMPTKAGGRIAVREIPLDKLEREVIDLV